MEEKDIVNFLKEVKRRGGTNKKDIVSKLKLTGKRYDDLFQYCEDNNCINYNAGKQRYVINAAGNNYIFNYMEKQNIEKREDSLLKIQRYTLIALVITALAALASAYLSYCSYTVISSSMIPNEATLDVFPRFIGEESVFEENSLRHPDPCTARLYICVKNYGRLSSGLVNLEWISDSESLDLLPSSETIYNVEGRS